MSAGRKTLKITSKELGEQSLCLSMLHKSAEAIYSSKAQWIDLPVIVLSTLCGSLTLSAKSLFGAENEENALKVVGGLSLLSGVLGTIQAYFSFSRRAENHRNSYLEYAKLYRFVKVELGLPRAQRISAKDLIKIVNDSFERLNELSQLIPEKTLAAFRSRYKKNPLKKPPIVNGLEEIVIFSPQSDEESSDSDSSDPRDRRRRKKRRSSERADIEAALRRAQTMEDLMRRPTLRMEEEATDAISQGATAIGGALGAAQQMLTQAQGAASKTVELTSAAAMQRAEQAARQSAGSIVSSVLSRAVGSVVADIEGEQQKNE